MTRLRLFALPALLISTAAAGQAPNAPPAAATPRVEQSQPPPTVASVVDRQISGAEWHLVEAAEAMPEDKFDFSPETLKIPGAEYKGVRTFSAQVKHVAASNHMLWATLTGDKIPADIQSGEGPANLKTKAEIIKFLKDSYALGHRAAATLTTQNMLESVGDFKLPRVQVATFAVSHANDHYGQMVKYLRMNGIVPPASRGNSN